MAEVTAAPGRRCVVCRRPLADDDAALVARRGRDYDPVYACREHADQVEVVSPW